MIFVLANPDLSKISFVLSNKYFEIKCKINWLGEGRRCQMKMSKNH